MMTLLREVGYVFLMALLLGVGLGGTLPAQTQLSARLTVRVTGARNSKGRIGVALFADGAGFPGDISKAFRSQQAEINPDTLSAETTFDGIPHGTYAVAVFHDENMNGKLDKNFVGVPKEGYGASNNPRKRMGPPRFDEAKVRLDQTDQTIDIKLTY